MRSAGDRTPVVVAANKTDLVRTRQVTEDGQFTLQTYSTLVLVLPMSTTLSAVGQRVDNQPVHA